MEPAEEKMRMISEEEESSNRFGGNMEDKDIYGFIKESNWLDINNRYILG